MCELTVVVVAVIADTDADVTVTVVVFCHFAMLFICICFVVSIKMMFCCFPAVGRLKCVAVGHLPVCDTNVTSEKCVVIKLRNF